MRGDPAPIILPATKFHVQLLAPHMREADKREVWAAGHRRPFEALMYSLESSPRLAWTAVAGNDVLAMWGVGTAGHSAGQGSPWLLGSVRLYTPRYRRELARRSKVFVKEMARQFELLVNYVDARNHESVRWIAWCGFTVFPTEPYGPDGVLFHRFEMRR